MVITNFNITSNRQSLSIFISDAALVSSLKLWTSTTYKDYSLSIDLSTFLTGASEEDLEIDLWDLNIPYFDGVYFLEASTDAEISMAVTADLTRYKECILNKVISITQCNDCLKVLNNDILNSQAILYSLETAVENGFIDEIMLLVEALNKFCSNNCKSCGEYKNLLDTDYYSSINPF